MTADALSVLCANCGGDELLFRLMEGTTACPWCGLSFDDDDRAPAGETRPVYLRVILHAAPTTSKIERAEEVAR